MALLSLFMMHQENGGLANMISNSIDKPNEADGLRKDIVKFSSIYIDLDFLYATDIGAALLDVIGDESLYTERFQQLLDSYNNRVSCDISEVIDVDRNQLAEYSSRGMEVFSLSPSFKSLTHLKARLAEVRYYETVAEPVVDINTHQLVFTDTDVAQLKSFFTRVLGMQVRIISKPYADISSSYDLYFIHDLYAFSQAKQGALASMKFDHATIVAHRLCHQVPEGDLGKLDEVFTNTELLCQTFCDSFEFDTAYEIQGLSYER
jgi:hypothetical protein